MTKAIGIDVGGTNLRVGLFEGVNLIQEVRIQTDFSTICQNNVPVFAWQEILKTITNGLEPLLTAHPDVAQIGIGFPGFIHPQTNIIEQSPNLPGLSQVNLATDLGQLLDKQVVVVNDANAAAYGEYCLASKPEGGLVYLGLGTGVGGGLVVKGRPYTGEQGCAMEAGHIIIEPEGRLCGCGNQGCMEQYASASGVSLSYYYATQRKRTAAEIAELARSGRENAVKAYQIAGDALAQSLASILKVINISHVVIGGGLTNAWDLMREAFEQRLNQDLIPVLRGKVIVEISKAEDVAGMLGAAMLASECK